MDPVAERIREAEKALKQGQTVRWRQLLREAVALDAESPPTPERADAWAAHARVDLPATERYACWVRAVAAASVLGDDGRLARFTPEERRCKREARAQEVAAEKSAKARRAEAEKKATAKPDKGAVGRWETALRARLKKRFAEEDVDPDRQAELLALVTAFAADLRRLGGNRGGPLVDALEATDRPLEVVASETDAKQRLAELADFDDSSPLDALEGILAAVEY